MKKYLIFSLLLTSSLSLAGGSKLEEKFSLPKEYESLSGCSKQDLLWTEIKKTKHSVLPDYAKIQFWTPFQIANQKLSQKMNYHSDIVPTSPKKWIKHLHRRGSVAKIKFIPVNTNFTGVFKGAECGFLRLSLTYKPLEKKGFLSERGFAPGLALKLFRDQKPSANISALYSLSGQEQNYNFFENALSNIVPIGDSYGEQLIHTIFSRVTKYPEQLSASDFSKIDQFGLNVKEPKSPKQIFFVPTAEIRKKYSKKKHDPREDFLKIPSGNTVYKVYAVSESIEKNFNYYYYKAEDRKIFLKKENREQIGSIVTTSDFINSSFGDDKLFFKHEKVD